MMSISIGGTIAYFSVSTDQSVQFLKNDIEIKQVITQRDESFEVVESVIEQDYDYYLLPDELYPEGIVKFWPKSPYSKDKIVSVKNQGLSPVFVRTVFAYPCDTLFQFNVVETISDEKVWEWCWSEEVIEIDGKPYYVAVASYVYDGGVLLPNESTYPSLLEVKIQSRSAAEVSLYMISQGVSADGEDALTVLNERLGNDYEKLFNR